MSLEYVERRIKEALRAAKGNKAQASKQIMAWTYEDARLLHELTRHHLPGIVAYHIERVDPGAAALPKKLAAGSKPKKAASKEEKFGLELLKAVAGPGAARFGLEGPAATARRGQASQQHMDAIRQIAGKSKANGAKPKKKK